MLEIWKYRCAWCGKPLFFSEMQVDHVLPQSLTGPALDKALSDRGLGDDYDLNALPNLVPSCRRCNSGKGERLAPHVPAISLLLDRTAKHAPSVERLAARFKTKHQIEKALVIVREAASEDASVLRELLTAVGQVGEAVRDEVGSTPTRLHPAITYLASADRWEVVAEMRDDVVFVTDGQRAGRTGKHWSWECPNCGSYGPWNGNICLSCGRMDPGFDY